MDSFKNFFLPFSESGKCRPQLVFAAVGCSVASTAAAAASLIRFVRVAERHVGRRRDDRDAGAGRRRLVAGREANVDPIELVSGARFVGAQR